MVIYDRAGAPGSAELSARVSRLRTVAIRQGWIEPVVITECRSGISDRALCVIADYEHLSRRFTRVYDIVKALSESGVRIVTPSTVGASAEAVPFELMLVQAIAAPCERDEISRRTRTGIAAARARRAGRQ